MTERYDASSISVLEGIEAVRHRPGMYIGGTGAHGLHHLLWEVVDNSVDEAMNGHATTLTVKLDKDRCGATVTDNGRGIPFDLHKATGKPALEIIFTTLHAGGKFGRGTAYHTSGGLHGVGASVVNALAVELEVRSRREGKEACLRFERGVPKGTMKTRKGSRGTGTTVYFRPDPEIFDSVQMDPELVAERLDIKAYLNRGLRIAYDDGSGSKQRVYHHAGGVEDFLAHVVSQTGKPVIHAKPFVVHLPGDDRLEIALQWTADTREQVLGFANTIPTRDGGTHVQGLREGVVKAVRNYLDTHTKAPRGLKITADDIREGLVCIVSAFVREPQLQGQTKDRLNNPDLRGLTEGAVRAPLEQWLYDNPTIGDALATRIIQAARAREASRAAANQVRRKSPVSRRLNLPGKLADCSSQDASQCELFLVEGDSAGGSAKQGRDRRTQAILPLRGKVLNAEQATATRVAANQELSDIVLALGCGVGEGIKLETLRYNKIILLADADSDGHHITTLLLTFFYRYLRPLIDGGMVFVAQPPLYRLDHGKKTWWATDDRERDSIIHELPKNARVDITRFKGLGEMMPKVLFQTTMSPRTRHLLRVMVPEGAEMETDQTFQDLMGRDAAPRFRLVTEDAEGADLDV